MQKFFGWLESNVLLTFLICITTMVVFSFCYTLVPNVYLKLTSFGVIFLSATIAIISLQLRTFPDLFRAIKLLPKLENFPEQSAKKN